MTKRKQIWQSNTALSVVLTKEGNEKTVKCYHTINNKFFVKRAIKRNHKYISSWKTGAYLLLQIRTNNKEKKQNKGITSKLEI